MMLMKKTAAILLLALLTALSFASCATSNGVEQIAWDEYDELIAEIKTESDAERREVMLHIAEDMLMETECIMPLYNYRDAYMMKSSITGVYSTEFGAKYFKYAASADRTDIILNFCDAPKTFDPALAESTSELTIVANTFSGLYTYNEIGNVVPDLVSDCTISDDGLTYTFTLKPNILWSDGSYIGAKDFIYSWRRVADPSTDSPYAHFLDIIARDEEDKFLVTSDETDSILTVTLVAPCDYFIELCAFPALYPVKESAVEYAEGYVDSYGNILDADAWTKKTQYPTSGAYTLVSNSDDSQYVFGKNLRYWNNAEVSINSLNISLASDSGAAYNSYLTGDIDYIDTVPDFVRESAAIDFHVDDISSVYYLCHNFNSDIYSGMSVENAASLRRAISLCIDREYITSSITGNGETVATSIIPELLSDGVGGKFRENDRYHKYPNMNCVGYLDLSTSKNKEEARMIIKSLGLDADDDGVIDPEYRFGMEYLTMKNTHDIMIAQSVQQDLAEIGIVVEIKTVDESVFDYERTITTYDMISCRSIAYYDDPLAVLQHWIIDSDMNYAGLGTEIIIENENAY